MLRNPRTAFLLYLGSISIVGGIIISLATSRMGPGVSTDSAIILATAENLTQGRGLIDYSGAQLTQFPPLYSIILAGGSLLFRQDVFRIGWTLNILAFAALIWFSGRLLHYARPDEPILAYVGAFIVLSSTSLIEISSNIASDPLFMLIVVFFLRSAAAYLRSGSIKDAVLAGALTIIGCFQRYAGLSLVIAGSLIAAYRARKNLRRAAASALLFGLLTVTPILAWGFWHNAPINGTVFGARLPSVPVLNFAAGMEKVLYWFIPYRIISSVGAINLLVVISIACILAVVATRSVGLRTGVAQSEMIPHAVFLLVYFAVLVFDISYYELKGLKTDRVHIIALPSLLLVLSFLAGRLLHASKARFGHTATYVGAILAFLLWSTYPISKSKEYVQKSMATGDISSYNSINKGDIRNSALSRYLNGLEMSQTPVYSNGPDTTWFILRKQVDALPRLSSVDRLAELRLRYSGWPGSEGYLVWVNAEAHKSNYATPTELSSIASIEKLYTDENAAVYFVKSH
jgi:hypothetical protein